MYHDDFTLTTGVPVCLFSPAGHNANRSTGRQGRYQLQNLQNFVHSQCCGVSFQTHPTFAERSASATTDAHDSQLLHEDLPNASISTRNSAISTTIYKDYPQMSVRLRLEIIGRVFDLSKILEDVDWWRRILLFFLFARGQISPAERERERRSRNHCAKIHGRKIFSKLSLEIFDHG